MKYKLLLLIITMFSCDNSTNSQSGNNTFNTDSLEIPNHNNISIRQYKDFKLQYDEGYELSSWVAYVLTKEKLEKNFDRTDNFRPDPEISTGTADDEDYAGSGYDRGHLMPAGDCTWDSTTMSESFYYSNIAPQTPGLNRGEWSQLEEDFRELALMYDSLWIVTGPVLVDDQISGAPLFDRIGINNVAVPRRYYKAGIFKVNNEFHGVAFIMPNQAIDNDIPFTDFQMSIDELEIQLDMDLFSRLPDDIETEVEAELYQIY